MSFTDAERNYLAGQMLGRFATVGPDGTPQVRP
jgi:pyridoxamine 5'-phosphate oxidase family protein